MPPYRERLRPQFHFTPRKGWMNDPNGLVFQDGEYHLFFQHNPTGKKWGNIHWGNAVSRDLVHWTELPDALEPDGLGMMWSGSAVVDGKNTSGLGTGSRPPIVAIYTATNVRRGWHAVQCLAASNDGGRTLVKFEGNPVLPRLVGVNRDPKVVWHGPTGSWIMALYLDGNDFALFRSPDLRAWERIDDVPLPGVKECPDFFELPVDGDPVNSRWVFWGAAGAYRLGTFDGRHFTAETETLTSEFGSNGYAAQTWSDLPPDVGAVARPRDGRRIQVSWMRGGRYPRMPFNGQMSFPVELSLRSFPDGPRLCRMPVREIEILHRETRRYDGVRLAPGTTFAPEVRGDLFDIEATLSLAPKTEEVGLFVHGTQLRYLAGEGCFLCLGKKFAAPASGGRLTLRLLVDRTSLELFVPPGRISAGFCRLPEARAAPLELYALGGGAEASPLVVRELASAWR